MLRLGSGQGRHGAGDCTLSRVRVVTASATRDPNAEERIRPLHQQVTHPDSDHERYLRWVRSNRKLTAWAQSIRYLATLAALVEMLVPLLTWTNQPYLVWLSIATFMCMHAFIISTLIIDVFAWNFTDAVWYVILFGVVATGVNWPELASMDPMLMVHANVHLPCTCVM